MKNIQKLASFFYEIGTLRKIARAHRQTLMTDDLSDNIASHSYRVTMIGYFLAKLEKAKADEVVLMCLFHDTSEARSGDMNWVHKRYVKVYENEITKEQLKDLPAEKELTKATDSYEKRESIESKLAKDADLLDQILLLREYELAGNKEAASWLSSKNEQQKRLWSKSGKILAEEIMKQEPHEWWEHLYTADRRK